MKARQQKIDAFVAANGVPTTTSSGAAIARQGARFHTLVSSAGDRTTLGAYWEQKTGKELPRRRLRPATSPRPGGRFRVDHDAERQAPCRAKVGAG